MAEHLLLHVHDDGREEFVPDPLQGRLHLRVEREGNVETTMTKTGATPPGRGWRYSHTDWERSTSVWVRHRD
jgi:hypothetical protein